MSAFEIVDSLVNGNVRAAAQAHGREVQTRVGVEEGADCDVVAMPVQDDGAEYHKDHCGCDFEALYPCYPIKAGWQCGM